MYPSCFLGHISGWLEPNLERRRWYIVPLPANRPYSQFVLIHVGQVVELGTRRSRPPFDRQLVSAVPTPSNVSYTVGFDLGSPSISTTTLSSTFRDLTWFVEMTVGAPYVGTAISAHATASQPSLAQAKTLLSIALRQIDYDRTP